MDPEDPPGRALAMKRTAPLFSILCLILVWAAAPGCDAETERDWPTTKRQVREAFPTVTQLSTGELAAWLESDRPPPILIDARPIEEYAVSHLAGAIRATDADQVDAAIGGGDGSRPIVLYCSVGYRSSELAEQLMDRGYTDVMNLEGSIFEWANAGRPVVRDGQPVEAVHPYDEDWGRLLNRNLWATQPD